MPMSARPPENMVNGCRRFRQHAGIPKQSTKNQTANTDPFRRRSECRHSRNTLEAGVIAVLQRIGIKMVPDGYPVKAIVVSGLPQPLQFVVCQVLGTCMHPDLDTHHRDLRNLFGIFGQFHPLQILVGIRLRCRLHRVIDHLVVFRIEPFELARL